jgi:enoyl-[acyl-carrier-protein] reductase (NADH)
VYNRRKANIPMRIEASGDDIAEAVAFLASDAAKNICGERLIVDGGCSAQLFPLDIDK